MTQTKQGELPFEGEHNETLREAANRWIDANPEAMHQFRVLAEMMRSRRRRFGAKQLAERVRWEMSLNATDGEDGFKISNHFVAYIARRLVQDDDPRLAELIECRVLKAADKPYRKSVRDPRVDPLTDEPMDGE